MKDDEVISDDRDSIQGEEVVGQLGDEVMALL
jgi:hypothetical protein